MKMRSSAGLGGERMFRFEAAQHSCQNQSWMGCSYPQPIRELFINAAANQACFRFACSYLDFTTATCRKSSVHYVWLALPDLTPNAILEKLQVNCESQTTAIHVSEQRSGAGKKKYQNILGSRGKKCCKFLSYLRG